MPGGFNKPSKKVKASGRSKYAEGGKVKSAFEKAKEEKEQADKDLDTVRKKGKGLRFVSGFKKGGKVK